MTYSNRPVRTAFQHGSEFDKSPDNVSCRKLNPYLDNMPGATSAPYDYSKPEPPPKNGESSLNDPEPSPICDWATTMGDNTISVCKPPYEYNKELKCPMSRPLEPQRRIDPGMWAYNKQLVKQTSYGNGLFSSKDAQTIISIIGVLIVVLAILELLRNKK